MPIPNLPDGPADIARLIARVEQLERQFRDIGFAGLDGLSADAAALSRFMFQIGFDTGTFQATFSAVASSGAEDVTLTTTQGSSTTDTVHIATAGIYAIAFNFSSIALPGTTSELHVDISFPEAFGGALDPVSLYGAQNPTGTHHATVSYTFVGYLDAGADIYANVFINLGTLQNSWCVVQRIA